MRAVGYDALANTGGGGGGGSNNGGGGGYGGSGIVLVSYATPEQHPLPI